LEEDRDAYQGDKVGNQEQVKSSKKEPIAKFVNGDESLSG
jgi:hypothetical protein